MAPHPETPPAPDNDDDTGRDEKRPSKSPRSQNTSKLHAVWELWPDTQSQLVVMANKSGLSQCEQEEAVSEVMHRFIRRARSQGLPRCTPTWVCTTMGRHLDELRRGPRFSPLKEGPTEDLAPDLSNPLPGTKDFWLWFDTHRSMLKRKAGLTPLEWKTLLATRNAPTMTEAAQRCSLTKRDYRTLRNRGADRILRAIQKNLVPPPPL
jgi:hypothetical protein